MKIQLHLVSFSRCEFPEDHNFTFFKDTNSFRGGSKTAAITKTEHFVIIVNSWKPLTSITKRSILDVAAVLDTLLIPNIFVDNLRVTSYSSFLKVTSLSLSSLPVLLSVFV